MWPQNTYLIDGQYRFLYCPVPKVACTTLKRVVAQVIDPAMDQGRGIHGRLWRNHSLSVCRTSTVDHWLTNEAIYRFAFVRNPWDRLVSAYCSKFIRWRDVRNPFTKAVIDEVVGNGGAARSADRPDETSVSFREFVEHLQRVPDDFLDEHWKPQHLFLADVDFDFIGRFETLDDDFSQVAEHLALPVKSLPRSNQTPYRPPQFSVDGRAVADLSAAEMHEWDSIPTIGSFYDESLIALVKQRYATDAEQFNYNPPILPDL